MHLSFSLSIVHFFSLTVSPGNIPNIISIPTAGNTRALALIIYPSLQSHPQTNLIAVTVTKDNQWAAFPLALTLVDTFYETSPKVPIGTVRNGKTPESNPMIQVPSERRA